LGPWAMANYCRAVIKSPRGTVALLLSADAEAVEWNTNSSSRQPLDSDDSDQVSNSSITAPR
jgi:hypothetical protein